MMDHIVETNGLSVTFGQHEVIKNMNLSIEKGKFTSIIGPNGAGKTTLFNLLSGQQKPTKGSVYFKGKDITAMSVPERTRFGMGRSFQLTNVFPELTVLENVRLAVQAADHYFYRFIPIRKYQQASEQKAYGLLEEVMLSGKEAAMASELAHGEKRKLELAMLLALKPELLLLDEPTAGISVEEVPAILKVIENIKHNSDKTIILIEHKMDMVLHVSDQIAVLFNGELLSIGNPQDIINDPRVQNAYLGGMYNESIKSG